MYPDVLSGLAVSISAKAALEIWKKILIQRLNTKGVQIEGVDKESLAADILAKAEQIRGEESLKEASRSTQEAVFKQLTVLEKEKNRLINIATREHWVALFFAISGGLVFIAAIILAILGTTSQAMITLVATAVPGFLSRVFFAREANLEDRIKEISTDLRETEKARERLNLLEQALEIVPSESHAKLVQEYTKKMFRI